jgi:hypothetical protein
MVCSEVFGEGECVDVVLVKGVLREHRLVWADEVEAVRLDLNEEYAGIAREEESWCLVAPERELYGTRKTAPAPSACASFADTATG